MAIQKAVNTWMPKGLPGALVSLDGMATTTYSYLSDGTVQAGQFAFEAGEGKCTHAKENARLLGLVLRTQTTFTNVPIQNATNTYPRFANVTILKRGTVYFSIPEGASDVPNGQHLLCDPATGKVTFGDAGSPNDTGWHVELNGQEAAKAGDLVRIQNLG